MKNNSNTHTITETVGIFADALSMEKAVADLRRAGFEHSQVSLLANKSVVKKSLGHLYTDVTNLEPKDVKDESDSTIEAFVAVDSAHTAVSKILGALYFLGPAGVVIVAMGGFGTALLAAAASVAVVGSVEAALNKLIRKSEAEVLQKQLNRGHLLLFVQTLDARRETIAMNILKKHSSLEPHVIRGLKVS